jgi:acyl-CoA synthetase (NDP forming)
LPERIERVKLPAKQPIIERVKREARAVLTEVEAKELLSQAGIAVNDTRLAVSREEAVALSRQIGFPVALKIASPDVTHKSDSGGVRLGLKTARQVARAYEDILAAIKQRYPEVVVQGVSVQKMVRPGVEVIIGMSKDAQFGPVLMFGLGGVLVEILKDVSFRIVPLTRRDAHEMVREIKGYPLLEGYRGQEPADVSYLEELLLKVSRFVEATPEIRELDINPLFAYRDGAVAVDARVILEEDIR